MILLAEWYADNRKVAESETKKAIASTKYAEFGRGHDRWTHASECQLQPAILERWPSRTHHSVHTAEDVMWITNACSTNLTLGNRTITVQMGAAPSTDSKSPSETRDFRAYESMAGLVKANKQRWERIVVSFSTRDSPPVIGPFYTYFAVFRRPMKSCK
jgi:hypothetical protein